jgi:DNA modification methylase
MTSSTPETASMRDRIVELRRVPARELLPNPRNWRRHPPAQVAALRGALDDIGYANALLARETPDGLELIDGHLRAETTPDQEVPVLVLDVTGEEAAKILATLDPLAAMAETDEEALRELLSEVSIESADLLSYLQGLAGEEESKNGWADRQDSVPEITESVTKPGDLWILGRHRLLCGDATNSDDVKRLTDGRKAALFHTDPPYMVDYVGSDRPSHGKNWSELYREVDISDAEAFFRATFANAIDVCKADAAWYCWHAHKRAALIERIWDELDVLNHQQIIWVKPSILHGYAYYPWQHEPCLMGWRKGHKPKHDGKNTAEATSVWQLDWEGKARVVGNEHPTQKPVELFAIPMRKHTKRGDVCYEPFAGSGSQLIAAEREGRACYALEVEPHFCDVVVRRWEELTKQKAGRAEP